MEDTGFIYIAYGKKFVLEAKRSAGTLRNNIPNANITLFTDKTSIKHINNKHCFNNIILMTTQNTYIDKITNMKNTPYKKTVFLDSDTFIVEDISSLFGLLNYFDLGVVLSPNNPHRWPSGLEAIPEYNTGVILYKKNENTTKLFNRWEKIYLNRQSIDGHDQPSFSIALTQSPVQLISLPFEYNFFFNHPSMLSANVKILHGRTRSYEKIISRLNKKYNYKEIRAWSPAHQRCFLKEGSGLRRFIVKVRKKIFYILKNKFHSHGDEILPGEKRFGGKEMGE